MTAPTDILDEVRQRIEHFLNPSMLQVVSADTSVELAIELAQTVYDLDAQISAAGELPEQWSVRQPPRLAGLAVRALLTEIGELVAADNRHPAEIVAVLGAWFTEFGFDTKPPALGDHQPR